MNSRCEVHGALQDTMAIKFFLSRQAFAMEQCMQSLPALRPLLQPLGGPLVFVSNSHDVVRGAPLSAAIDGRPNNCAP